jgi:Ser/Thr protein kinase RdoA (MazF antagonist)
MSNDSQMNFYQLTPETLLNTVEAAYGIRCTGRVLALNSMENRVYEIEVENDAAKQASDRFVIAKFYRPGRWSKEQLLEEHQFMKDLHENEVPVVPPIVSSASGETLHHDTDSNLYFTLFPKASGRTPDELSDSDLEQLGRLIARVHSVGKTITSLHRLRLDLATYGVQNVNYLLEHKLIPPGIEENFKMITDQILAYCEPLFAAAAFQRIHGDSHLGNFIQRGKSDFYIVDFDDMLLGPPVQDLWLLIAGDEEEKRQKQDLLLNAYESMFAFDYTSTKLIEPLRALRYLHFATWIAKRWEDPAFKRAFPYFGSIKYWQDLYLDLREQLAKFYE